MLSVEKTPLSWLREDNLEAMMFAHWRECSIDHDAVPLNPDWELAAEMEKRGTLLAFGLFDDRKLVGYAVFEMAPHLMFKSTLYAWNTGFYVAPESRKGNAAFKLFVGCEDALKRMGVKKITCLAPNESSLNRLLGKGGYTPTERYYTKLVA
jgi:hypothetical protein